MLSKEIIILELVLEDESEATQNDKVPKTIRLY